jgi:hypothetical protein
VVVPASILSGMSKPAAAPAPSWNETPPERTQALEVVLQRDGVKGAPTPEDFRRVPVQAASPLQAMQHPDVAKAAAEGWTVLFADLPGHSSEPEMDAMARSFGARDLDRSRLRDL